jgi:hypothetical protein
VIGMEEDSRRRYHSLSDADKLRVQLYGDQIAGFVKFEVMIIEKTRDCCVG